MKAILVTGAAGFIGTNFVRMLLRRYGLWNVIAVDAFTYAGNFFSIEDLCPSAMLEFIKGDICDVPLVEYLTCDIDAIVNFAAQTDVDRSIVNCQDFIRTNVEGVRVLADAAVKHQVSQFIQVSTAEVYGSCEEGFCAEDAKLSPGNPYAASKAAADMLLASYAHTYGLPVITVRCCDNYGPWQFPEKMIPLFITRLLENQSLPVYGDGTAVRDWIHVEDHCRAIIAALENGIHGSVYNIAAHNEYRNIDVARMILEYMGKDESFIEYLADRPGHDHRYGIDVSKACRELGWSSQVDFKTGLYKTIDWYMENRDWVRQVTAAQELCA